MTPTTTPTKAPTRPNLALVAARVLVGLSGASTLAGVVFFVVVVPEEAVWAGPWLDVPVVGLMVLAALLKLVVALAPGLDAGRRVRLGLLAVGLALAVTLVKIPVYDEPEGVMFLAVDVVLGGVLLLARRRTRHA